MHRRGAACRSRLTRCLQAACARLAPFAHAHLPCLLPLQLKTAAMGAMAIVYQAAHFVGLAAATLLVYLLYGEIRPEQ